MRLRKRALHVEESHGIDLAPMLDFVLNLLIFFIITAVFVRESGMAVNRPSGSLDQPQGGAAGIPISIYASGEVVVDDRIVDPRAVRANVEKLHAAKPDSGVLVVADASVTTGLVATVIDQVRLAGVSDITFGTTE